MSDEHLRALERVVEESPDDAIAAERLRRARARAAPEITPMLIECLKAIRAAGYTAAPMLGQGCALVDHRARVVYLPKDWPGSMSLLAALAP